MTLLVDAHGAQSRLFGLGCYSHAALQCTHAVGRGYHALDSVETRDRCRRTAYTRFAPHTIFQNKVIRMIACFKLN